MQYLSFQVGLILLSIIAPISSILLRMARSPFLRLSNIPLFIYHNFSIHSSAAPFHLPSFGKLDSHSCNHHFKAKGKELIC